MCSFLYQRNRFIWLGLAMETLPCACISRPAADGAQRPHVFTMMVHFQHAPVSRLYLCVVHARLSLRMMHKTRVKYDQMRIFIQWCEVHKTRLSEK